MKTLVIGVMTGTSLDGIDLALVEITEDEGIEHVKLLHGETFPYPSKMVEKLRQLMNPTLCNAELFCSVNMELSKVYASVINTFLSTHHISSSSIELIGLHGQTIYHIDQEERADKTPSSLQIGDGSAVAVLTNIPVVNNFRNADIALGGTGAPLVPYADYILFKNHKHSVSIHNLGGISNVTVIPYKGLLDDVFAFDTGPANVLIDEAMDMLFHQSFDNEGRIAASGIVQMDIVNEVLSHPYFVVVPPKSTGRELFGRQYVKDIIESYPLNKPEDIIASLTYATALSIAQAYELWVFPFVEVEEIVFSGGGVHNLTLIEYLAELLPNVIMNSSSEYGINPNFKEAMAFALLGHETYFKRAANVKNATGASDYTILGQISYPSKKVQT